MNIDVQLVEHLISAQFPQWNHLKMEPVTNSGHDNRTFRLGEHMTVRLPSGKAYEPQAKKEAEWLPILAKQLALPITEPLAIGHPTAEYPFMWSVNKWLPGETVAKNNISLSVLAEELASFLVELESIDAANGPIAGSHNFYRGGDLRIYDAETKEVCSKLDGEVNIEKCQLIWERALLSKWNGVPVWVHGDIAPGNLLVEGGHLTGVIDFGILGTGDPACDLAMAWTFFDDASREIFIQKMKLDQDTWHRAKGWALWKALITYNSSDKQISENARYTIDAVLNNT